jgi:predicted DNA-binding protein
MNRWRATSARDDTDEVEMAKTRTNTLRMPPEMKAKLQQMAREQAATQRREVKWTDIVRAAIDKMLKEYAG